MLHVADQHRTHLDTKNLVSQMDLLRNLNQEDFIVMELEDLERISQFCEFAFSTRKKQRIEELEEKVLALDMQKQRWLEFEPKIKEFFAVKPIKLNVGGSLFSTTLENMVKEPNTYFFSLFGGKWCPKLDPVDGSVFIDRDPTMFAMILNYLRTGKISLDGLPPFQLQLLKDEADFYQVGSLLNLLSSARAFCAQVNGGVELGNNNRKATLCPKGEKEGYVSSLEPFSATRSEMNVKLVRGRDVLIGVASRGILEPNNHCDTCGWYLDCDNGTLYNQNHDNGRFFIAGGIREGSVVTVRLDRALNVSFAINGVEQGIAYRALARYNPASLYLVVGLYEGGASVEML